MKVVHKQALRFAAGYFALTLLIGFVCFMYSFGAGLSDGYYPDPPWIKVLMAALWGLQLPVAAFGAVMVHAKHGVNLLLLAMLGFLWSLALGYAFPWIRRTFGANSRPSGAPPENPPSGSQAE
jgi:steroid 5-alpha reductase family enzyme